MNLGKRIVVVGVSASGKSTLARELQKKVHLPLFHMDSFMWEPGWRYVGNEATIEHLDALSQKPEWIIEGYISTAARGFIFDRADTIIYLNYSRWVSAWRYIKRSIKHRKNARPELKGNLDRFDFKTLWLVWNKIEARSLEPLLKKADQNKIVVLKSPAEARLFLSRCC